MNLLDITVTACTVLSILHALWLDGAHGVNGLPKLAFTEAKSTPHGLHVRLVLFVKATVGVEDVSVPARAVLAVNAEHGHDRVGVAGDVVSGLASEVVFERDVAARLTTSVVH